MSAKSDAMRDMAATSEPPPEGGAGGEAEAAPAASVIRKQRAESAAKKKLQAAVKTAKRDRSPMEFAAQARAAYSVVDVTPGEARQLAEFIERHAVGAGLSRVSEPLCRIADQGRDVSIGPALARHLAVLILGDYSISPA